MSELPPELAGEHRLVKLLHRGVFGTVWHAVGLDGDRPGAVTAGVSLRRSCPLDRCGQSYYSTERPSNKPRAALKTMIGEEVMGPAASSQPH